MKLQVPVSQLISSEGDTAGKIEGAAIVQVIVDLQACNDTTCLAPESVTLDLSTASLTPQNSNIALAD